MIGHLRGRPIHIAPETVTLDVGGVGYQVHVSLSTYAEIERRGREAEVALFVHTHVRDDALALFGFWTEREKNLFLKLVAVSGIGPRLAQVILSGMPADELLAALAAADVPRLVRIPGVGKKTAERMVVELRDKVQALAAELPQAAASRPDEDLVMALVNLGYKPAAAERAVSDTARELPEAPFHELLRASLKRLSRA